ncbi:DUF5123 domain-containing protein [Gaoshiqia sediminis]|uniref:DUF5123 domain-containing protein n=1 Tax=Gaoshiqia sediminis TaxID=2986998 RepID=A0AA41Y5E9_9BACT|nr:DUF5123 domain-containing protein [Gaoshiqia sediminis]MCW0482175.1 DUF5123 domain-containing protein [Gaoshiqia sediminis]
MNFKKTINIRLIFATLAGLLLFNACVDKNDWDVDSSYSRMFRPANLAVTGVTATTADVNFVAIPGSAYYLVELSQDSLVFESIVATLDTTANQFTLQNLESNSPYSIRVQAISADASKPSSAWSELYFNTRAEQIMEPVLPGDIMSRSVNLRWTAGATVTNLQILDGDGTEVMNLAISAETMAAGSLKVTGLSPETSYTAVLLNGTKQRGSATFTTYPDVPDADLLFMMEATDVLTQETFDTLTVSSVTFAFPAGTYYNFSETLQLPTDVAFNFFGLPGDTKAILNIKQINMGTNHEYIKFINLDVTGMVYENGVPTGAVYDYLFNQSDEATVGSIEFSNCLIRDLGRTPLRLQGSGSNKYIGLVKIDNCLVYNMPDSYYFINSNVSTCQMANISITNSTFHNIMRMIMHTNSNNESLVISDCTFNNVLASGRYFIDMSTSYGPTSEFKITNSIFGDTADDNARGIRAASAPVVTNTFATSDFVLGGSSISGLIDYLGLSTDLFADPANGDFTIKDELFDGKSSAGDPRWRFQ